MERVIISSAEVQTEAMLRGQKPPQGYVGQLEILCDRGDLRMSLCPSSEVLPGLFPKLISPHALAVQLVWDSLDSHLDLRELWVVELLRVPLIGYRRVLEQHQDTLHAPRRDIEVDVPEGV